MTYGILSTLIALALLLLSEVRGSRAGVWIFKPLASTGFVATALAADATRSSYGRLVLLALLLAWLGDVLLIPRARWAFVAGLGSFLAGHLAFAAAFLVRGISVAWWIAAGLVLIVPAVIVHGWLRPNVPEPLRIPVRAYITAICVMVACALGTYGFAGGRMLLVGALMFFVSDLAVARERFVANDVMNKMWGLPLYYGGQILLAVSVAAS